jgi:hypothetical protein
MKLAIFAPRCVLHTVVVFSLAACSGGSAKVSDLGSPNLTSAARDLSASLPDLGFCNALAPPAATPIPATISTAAPPSFVGGVIADGTYVLTSQTFYDYSSDAAFVGQPLEFNLSVQGSVAQTSLSILDPSNAIITTSGATLTFSDTCPDTEIQSRSYTATPTTLTLGEVGDFPSGYVVVYVLTKQP